ncbi:MAG TPA: MBL fold metallo-hydrolase [Candidatus Dormibacteraeota bacterium]|nr:MBL fold metallo-hydrolase [Candidatus Dormibacteraeota bacterium]
MEITFVGLSCVRLRGRDVQVVIDPIPPGTAPGIPKLTPDIVVRTEGETSFATLRPADGRPQEVSGPGEYELKGVRVFGLPAGTTTIMRVEVDDVRVAAIGRLRRPLTEDEIESLGHVDVLLAPVGGDDAATAAEAAKLVSAVEPAIVVPVRYAVPGLPGQYEPVDKFAREMGLAEGSWAPQPKLNLTGSSGTVEETRVVVLEPRAGAA